MSANQATKEGTGIFPIMEEIFSAPPEVIEKLHADTICEVAPGRYAHAVDPDDVPIYCLAKIRPRGDDEFTLEPVEHVGWVRLTKSMKLSKAIKMSGLSYETLRRLCFAGFVEYCQFTPGCYFVNLDSLYAHINRTANCRGDDDGFWNEERLERWRATYAE